MNRAICISIVTDLVFASVTWGERPPTATINVGKIGGTRVNVVDPGEWIDEEAGLVLYEGEIAAESGIWTTTWSYVVNLSSDGEGAIDGAVTINNVQEVSTQFACSILVKIHEGEPIDTLIGGLSTIGLVTDAGGGFLNGGSILNYIHEYRFDGVTAMNTWPAATSIELEGQNSALLSASFGWPIETNLVPGPRLSHSIMLCHNFEIDGLDAATMTTSLYISADK